MVKKFLDGSLMDIPPSVILAARGSCRPAAETAEVRSLLHCNAMTDRFECVADDSRGLCEDRANAAAFAGAV